MPSPTYIFHKYTGMRFKYFPESPMLLNPQTKVLDEHGNDYIDVSPQQKPKTLTLKKREAA